MSLSSPGTTRTTERALPNSVTALEYAKPCQTVRAECGSEATVAVWMRHALAGCPGIKYMCSEHLASYLTGQGEWLARVRRCCICGGSVSGTVEDNVRVMPL